MIMQQVNYEYQTTHVMQRLCVGITKAHCTPGPVHRQCNFPHAPLVFQVHSARHRQGQKRMLYIAWSSTLALKISRSAVCTAHTRAEAHLSTATVQDPCAIDNKGCSKCGTDKGRIGFDPLSSPAP